MTNKNQPGIIIQARMGSTRLPGKMAMRFYDGKSLLEVVLNRLHEFLPDFRVVVATSISESDDYIAETSKRLGFRVFRGSESDVMLRFIRAAEEFNIEQIIRICADNPFIQQKYIHQLVNYNVDSIDGYVGFRLNGMIPAIKTHFGFFSERVSVKALKSIYNDDLDIFYREHVTNYFYSDENSGIPVQWIDLNYPESYLNKFRFTIDTKSDFNIANRIYKQMKEHHGNGSERQLFEYVASQPEILNKMNNSIKKNEK